jgi:hypothetical protein
MIANLFDRKFTFISVWILILPIFILIGCGHVPVNEFRAYHEAFTETKSVSQEVLSDYAIAKEDLARIDEAKKKKEGEDKEQKTSPFPTAFDPAEAMGVNVALNEIDFRLMALETISRYNDLLLALADGRSVKQVKSSATALTSSIASLAEFLPALGSVTPIAPLAKTLLSELEKARSREEFKKALQDGDKIVTRILDVLITDTVNHYGLRFALADGERVKIKARASKNRLIIKNVMKEHLPPTDENRLETIESDLNEKLEKMGWSTKTILTTRNKSGDQEKDQVWEYTALADTQITQTMNALDKNVAEYQRIVEKTNDYHAMLTSYVSLLEQTKQALRIVRVAMNTPVEIRLQAEELARVALSVRREIVNLRSK